MTAVVGVLCSDGAVVGTDSSVTMGDGMARTIEQPADKLAVVEKKIVLAGTGELGAGQRFKNVVEREWRNKTFAARDHRTNVDVCRDISKAAIEDFAETRADRSSYGALLAAPVGKHPVLCEFSVKWFQPMLYTPDLPFCSMGSSQPITDPFLALMREIFWPRRRPSTRDAVFAVTWALDHAIAVNPGGVNGPARVARLVADGDGGLVAEMCTDSDMAEHRSWIAEVKKAMASTLQTADVVPETPRAR